MPGRYDARGREAEFEPGSRGRVLRNRLGIRRAIDMQFAESTALDAVQEWAVGHFDSAHCFTANDICELHGRWLGSIYGWAGEYRSVNIAKGGFMFASAQQVPRLMNAFERDVLASETPCADMGPERLAAALARSHAELVLIHPFREGNGRCARLLCLLMAMQAGMPTLDFFSFSGRGKRRYIEAIHAAVNRDYLPMQACFTRAIRLTSDSFGVQS
jgi:cell filamentation protein